MSEQRRQFLAGITGLVAGIGATLAALPFFRSLKPPEHIKKQTWDVNFQKLKPGQMTVAVVEQKPIYITRRTPEQVAALKEANTDLRDPNSFESEQPEFAKNYHRSLKPEYFIAEGICTHLGCSPSHVEDGSGYFYDSFKGGYFCPCHGALYDAAGRVYIGAPAPTNLVVPPHEYINEHTIRISRSE